MLVLFLLLHFTNLQPVYANMFPILTFVVVLSTLQAAEATLHHLFVGTFGAASLYTVAFDDEALTLELVKNSTASVGHSWISFDVRTNSFHQAFQRIYIQPSCYSV
jgi:hypothetical protein